MSNFVKLLEILHLSYISKSMPFSTDRGYDLRHGNKTDFASNGTFNTVSNLSDYYYYIMIIIKPRLGQIFIKYFEWLCFFKYII